MPIRINDITLYDPELDAELRRWRVAIERANTWTFGGACEASESDFGYALFIPGALTPYTAVAGTGGITASPSEDVLGEGPALLKIRETGPNLVDGRTVKVYSAFRVAVPAGTKIEIIPDREAYKLVGADCPLT